jgi:hypothetical protein
MKILDFIENEAHRTKSSKTLLALVCVLGVFALAAYGLGLGFESRAPFQLAQALPPFVMSLLLGATLYSFLSAAPWRRKAPWLLVAFVAFLSLSFLHPYTLSSLKGFEMGPDFWAACWHCMSYSAGSSALATLVLAGLFWKFLPLPSARWQKVFAAVPGLSGVVVLTYHCVGSEWTHVAASHWGQLFIVLPLAYLALRGVFSRRTRDALSQSSLVDLNRIG